MRSCQKRLLPTALGLACTAGLLLSGCASPGPPRPPSLHLPEVVTDIKAERIGNQVELKWTIPAVTTDGQANAGIMTAVLCREDVPLPAKTAKSPAPCQPLQRIPVSSGAFRAVDVVQNVQVEDPPSLLGYRVELLNAKGRSAGPSPTVYAASGTAPATVSDFHAQDSEEGVRLSWRKDDLPVQVRRISANGQGKKASVPSGEVLLSAGDRDEGGMIDTSAIQGEVYQYSAIRVRTVAIGGQSLKISSAAWTTLTHQSRDTFPPPVPVGLAVIPGFGGSPSVDLSWEPVAAADLAGYIVYRKTGDTWVRLTPQPVESTTFRDTNAAPNASYTYRVTSVDQTGNESRPSLEVPER